MTSELDAHGLLVACSECGQKNRLRWLGLGKMFRCGKCAHDLSLPAVPVEVPTEAIFDALIRGATLPVLVDFWAPWCGPCRMVAPEFEKVAEQEMGRCLVAKVDTERVPHLGERHHVRSIPSMALFRAGEEIGRQVGAMPAAQIRQFVESNLE
ncbi:MAG: thioredoxin [Verrucomicrobiota bacterium]